MIYFVELNNIILGARCTGLLTAYGLDTQGTLTEKKKRLKKFFGVVIDLGTN